MGKTVMVLGGGVGGITAANRLRRSLPSRDRVVLVEQRSRYVFQPSLLWLAVGDRTTDQIRRPVASLCRKGVEVLKAEVTRIDAAAKTVTIDGQKRFADAIVIALGAEMAPELIPGLLSGHNLYGLEGAAAIRRALAKFRGGKIALLTTTSSYKCPAAPYEAAMLIEAALHQRGIRLLTSISLYAAESEPMGVAGPEVSEAVQEMVHSKGIAYHPEHQIKAVDERSRTLIFTNGAHAGFDLLIYVPPHRAPSAVRQSGLVDSSGWIPVDRKRFNTVHPGVFAIGDVTTVPLPMGRPLPKAAVFAAAQAETVGRNIADLWAGRTPRRKFDGYGACFVETGNGRAAFGSGDFYADPTPEIEFREPSRWWHWGKVLFERRWLRNWF